MYMYIDMTVAVEKERSAAEAAAPGPEAVHGTRKAGEEEPAFRDFAARAADNQYMYCALLLSDGREDQWSTGAARECNGSEPSIQRCVTAGVTEQECCW